MDPLETIREKLAKLRAIVNCAGAPEGEKAAARAGIARLLERHGLTEESVNSSNVSLCVIAFNKARWGRQLALQCAGWLLQIQPVPVYGIDREHMSMKLTALDAADLRACYAYYCGIMQGQMAALDDKAKNVRKDSREETKKIQQRADARLKEINADKAGMLDALVMKFQLRIHVKPSESDKEVRITDKELKEFLKKARRASDIKGDAWQRGPKVGEGEEVFRLEA